MKRQCPIYTSFDCFKCNKRATIIIGNRVRFNNPATFQCSQCGQNYSCALKTDLSKDSQIYIEVSEVEPAKPS